MSSNPYTSVTDLVLEGHNVIVTGQAGTGKSHLLCALADLLTQSGKTVQKAASTGLAASVIDREDGSCTLHSLCGLKIGQFSDAELRNVASRHEMMSNLRAIDVLLLDEVSMLSADIIRQANLVCCHARRCTSYFGGIQVVVAGDFYQLPPVTGDHLFAWPEFQRAIPHRIDLNFNYRCATESKRKLVTCFGHAFFF